MDTNEQLQEHLVDDSWLRIEKKIVPISGFGYGTRQPLLNCGTDNTSEWGENSQSDSEANQMRNESKAEAKKIASNSSLYIIGREMRHKQIKEMVGRNFNSTIIVESF